MKHNHSGQGRPAIALSDLTVTEFLTLGRLGFIPHGLVVGAAVYEADTRSAGGSQIVSALFGGGLLGNALAGALSSMPTGEITALSEGVRAARKIAISRMTHEAQQLGAEGVVGVHLEVEHHLWRGGHQVAKFIAVGTAVGLDHSHMAPELVHAPSLRLSDGLPFTSDLSGTDFVALLQAGFRPVTVASGTCVYQLNLQDMRRYQGQNAEIAEYTRAFFDARETAMGRLQYDLFQHWPAGHPDAPHGIVGMTVSEEAHRPALLGAMMPGLPGGGGRNAVSLNSAAPIVEFSAVGTAVKELLPNDPRRAKEQLKPLVVVPLDR